MFKSKVSYPDTTTSELLFKTGLNPEVAEDDPDSYYNDSNPVNPDSSGRRSSGGGGVEIGSIEEYELKAAINSGSASTRAFAGRKLEKDLAWKKDNRKHSAEITVRKKAGTASSAIEDPSSAKGFPVMKQEIVFKSAPVENNTEEDEYENFTLEVKSLDTGEVCKVVGSETNGLADLSIGERRRLSSGSGVVIGKTESKKSSTSSTSNSNEGVSGDHQQLPGGDELVFNLSNQPYSASDEKEEPVRKYY